MPELDPHIFGEGQPCFGCSPNHPIGFHLRFRTEGLVGNHEARTPEGRPGFEVVTDFTPGENYQGPPGIMHGGLVSTLADEIAAWAIIGLLDKFGFTATMTCKFTRPVRIGIPVEGRAKITRETSRIVQVDVKIRQNDQDAFMGDFTFVLLDRSAAENARPQLAGALGEVRALKRIATLMRKCG